MKHTWANPGTKWGGFRLTPYSLDATVLNLPLNQKRELDGKVVESPTTVGAIYDSLADQRVGIKSALVQTEITTDTEKLVIAGPTFIVQVLEDMLRLRNEGVNPFSANWFYYDSVSSMEEPNDLYTFFVACDDKIVREDVSFRDCPGSGFDPSIFQAGDSDAWGKAITQFWYRKFYTETRIGRLMVLREPALSDRWHLDTTGRLLRKICALLWVLIVLVCLMLIRLWK